MSEPETTLGESITYPYLQQELVASVNGTADEFVKDRTEELDFVATHHPERPEVPEGSLLYELHVRFYVDDSDDADAIGDEVPAGYMLVDPAEEDEEEEEEGAEDTREVTIEMWDLSYNAGQIESEPKQIILLDDIDARFRLTKIG